MKANVEISNIGITDDKYSIEYVAKDIGVVGRIHIPLTTILTKELISLEVEKEILKLKPQLEAIEALKKELLRKNFEVQM